MAEQAGVYKQEELKPEAKAEPAPKAEPKKTEPKPKAETKKPAPKPEPKPAPLKAKIKIKAIPEEEEIHNLNDYEKRLLKKTTQDQKPKKPQKQHGATLIETKVHSDFIFKHKIAPASFSTPEHVALGLEVAKSFGARNFGEATLMLKNMAFIKGNFTIWGELPLAIIHQKGMLEKIDRFFVDKEGQAISQANKNIFAKPEAHIVRIKRKDSKENEYILTRADLLSAGFIELETGGFSAGKNSNGREISDTWVKYSKIMWSRRNTSFALKMEFPDDLLGVSIKEYDIDIPREDVEIKNKSAEVEKKSKEDFMNSYLEKKKKNT